MAKKCEFVRIKRQRIDFKLNNVIHLHADVDHPEKGVFVS